MDGVTILNEIEYVTTIPSEFNDNAALTTLLITIIICAIIGFVLGLDDDMPIIGIIVGALCGVMLGAFMGVFLGALFAEPDETKTMTRYEVTIDDSVSMNEFTDKYNIVEQRGQIWVVEEKEE